MPPPASVSVRCGPGHGRVLSTARARSTALSMSVRSVINPSTPRSMSARISSGSSTVHTCTCLPAAWARRTRPRLATVSGPPAVRGSGAPRPTARQPVGQTPAGQSRKAATSRGAAEVGTRPWVRRRNSPQTPSENEPTSTRSQPALLDEGGERGDRALGLEVDVEPGVREGVEQLGQGRHPLAPADEAGRTSAYVVRRSSRCGR